MLIFQLRCSLSHTQLQVWIKKKTKLSEPSRSSNLRKGPRKTVSLLYENKLPVPVLKMLLRGSLRTPRLGKYTVCPP